MNVSETVKIIKKNFNNLESVNVEWVESGLSASTYTMLYQYNEENEDESKSLKIRISDHSPRPTYDFLNGSADIEIGDYFEGHHNNWWDVVVAVFNFFDQKAPMGARRMATIAAKKVAEKKALEKAEYDRRKENKLTLEEVEIAENIASSLESVIYLRDRRARGKHKNTSKDKITFANNEFSAFWEKTGINKPASISNTGNVYSRFS